MLNKEYMTISELYQLMAEYARMRDIAQERNCYSQEMRLIDMMEELDRYIVERVGEDA